MCIVRTTLGVQEQTLFDFTSINVRREPHICNFYNSVTTHELMGSRQHSSRRGQSGGFCDNGWTQFVQFLEKMSPISGNLILLWFYMTFVKIYIIY